MIKKLMALVLVLFTVTNAQASYCMTTDGLHIKHGEATTLYFKTLPRTQIGRNYTCVEVSRVRTCIDGEFSAVDRQCSEFDSGGCVDSWLSQLPDSEFIFGNCLD